MTEHNQQFATFEEWVNKAPSWLTRHPCYNIPTFRALCFDAKGRICASGEEFHRARDENTFPIRWVWPDQIAEMDALLRQVAAIKSDDIKTNGAGFVLGMVIEKCRARQLPHRD